MKALGFGWMPWAACLAAGPLFSQNTGRFADQTRRGIELVEKGKFNQAINLLEEVWEQDHSDPAVPENLGLAYLYAEGNGAKALDLMEQAIAAGGRASFLMQHVHEKGLIGGEITDFCQGRLSIYHDRLAFTSSSVAEHSFTIPAGELREVKTNRSLGKGQGTYHITTLDRQHYNLRPRSWSEVETEIVLGLISKHISRKK